MATQQIVPASHFPTDLPNKCLPTISARCHIISSILHNQLALSGSVFWTFGSMCKQKPFDLGNFFYWSQL